MPEKDALIRELLGFQMKISASGHDTYDAKRESIHDDLVIAVALAAWYAEQGNKGLSRLRALATW